MKHGVSKSTWQLWPDVALCFGMCALMPNEDVINLFVQMANIDKVTSKLIHWAFS